MAERIAGSPEVPEVVISIIEDLTVSVLVQPIATEGLSHEESLFLTREFSQEEDLVLSSKSFLMVTPKHND